MERATFLNAHVDVACILFLYQYTQLRPLFVHLSNETLQRMIFFVGRHNCVCRSFRGAEFQHRQPIGSTITIPHREMSVLTRFCRLVLVVPHNTVLDDPSIYVIELAHTWIRLVGWRLLRCNIASRIWIINRRKTVQINGNARCFQMFPANFEDHPPFSRVIYEFIYLICLTADDLIELSPQTLDFNCYDYFGVLFGESYISVITLFVSFREFTFCLIDNGLIELVLKFWVLELVRFFGKLLFGGGSSIIFHSFYLVAYVVLYLP